MISLLCEIVALRRKAPAYTCRRRRGYGALLRSGLLREAGVVQSVGCLECQKAHDADVVIENGAYGHWCPELGFVSVDPSMLIGVEPDLAKLTALLADAFDCKRRKSTPVLGDTWRVGAVETGAGDLCIYLSPGMLDQSDVDGVLAALSREIRPAFRLVLTATGTLTVLGGTTARLDDVVALDAATGMIAPLSDPCVVAGVPQKRAGGRPSPFRNSLKAIIQERVKSGCALPGLNEEAHTILEQFRTASPDAAVPSLSTVKRALFDFRARS